MGTFKSIDLWLQLILSVAGVAYFLYNPGNFYYAYYVLGGWQLISTLIHLFFKNDYYPVKDRLLYTRTILGIVIVAGISWLLSAHLVLLVIGAILLFLSPLMAIWYISMCHTENKMIRHKLLIHLK